MQTNALCLVALLAATSPFAASAQGTATGRPLSAIDWLDSVPQSKPIVSLLDEPRVSNGVHIPGVSVTALDGPAVQIIGLVSSTISGLPRDLWAGSDATELTKTLARMCHSCDGWDENIDSLKTCDRSPEIRHGIPAH